MRVRLAQRRAAELSVQLFALTVGADFNMAADKHVVACRLMRVMPAFQPGDAAVDERRCGVSGAETHTGEAIGVRARKSARELDLVVSQNVDGVSLDRFEGSQTARTSCETPGDQRRVERHRVERVRGKSYKSIVAPARRDNRDSSGEPGERVAKLLLLKRVLRRSFGGHRKESRGAGN